MSITLSSSKIASMAVPQVHHLMKNMRKKRKSKKAGLDVLTSLFKMVFRGRGFPCQFITISRTGGYLGLRSGPTASGAIVYIVDHGCI